MQLRFRLVGEFGLGLPWIGRRPRKCCLGIVKLAHALSLDRLHKMHTMVVEGHLFIRLGWTPSAWAGRAVL